MLFSATMWDLKVQESRHWACILKGLVACCLHRQLFLHCILPSTKAPKSTTLLLLDSHNMLLSNSMVLLCKGRQINIMPGAA